MLLRALMNGSMLSGSSGGSLAPRALRRLATVLMASLALQAAPPVTGLAAVAAVAPPCVRADVRPMRRVAVVGEVRFCSIL